MLYKVQSKAQSLIFVFVVIFIFRFFTYGHLPLESHLEFIDSSLSNFCQIEPSVKVPLEPRWKKPVSVMLSLLKPV